jgi:hypothetical protein
VKRVEQHALVALHRVREQWMTTPTARINTRRKPSTHRPDIRPQPTHRPTVSYSLVDGEESIYGLLAAQ